MYLYCKRCGSIFLKERNIKGNGIVGEVTCPGCDTKEEENFYGVTDTEYMTLMFVSVLGNDTIRGIRLRGDHKLPPEEERGNFRRDLLKWWGSLK